MLAPRLRIGAIGWSELYDKLLQVGHTGTEIFPGEEAANVDLIILGNIDVEDAVEKILPYVSEGQMVLHTALEHGVQVLDSLEIQGVIVMAAHRIWSGFWVTSAADELGETVVGLLVGESGGNSAVISDSQRLRLMAAQQLRALEREVRWDAFELVRSVVPGIEVEADAFLGGEDRPEALMLTSQQREAIRTAIGEPDAAALYDALERRASVRRGYPYS